MRVKIIVKFAAAVLLLGVAGSITACNTIGGLGEDVSNLGNKMTKKADQTERRM